MVHELVLAKITTIKNKKPSWSLLSRSHHIQSNTDPWFQNLLENLAGYMKQDHSFLGLAQRLWLEHHVQLKKSQGDFEGQASLLYPG